MKVSYSCTENISNIISSRNKRLIKNNAPNTKPCNCRTKSTWPLNGQVSNSGRNLQITVLTSVNPDKVYLGTAEGDFRKCYYNHVKFFRNKRYTNDASLSRYIWVIKEHQEKPSLKWSIVKSVPAYSNITKKCLACLHKKLEIVNYPVSEELLNKRSELVSKCLHANKYLLNNYKVND